METVMTPRLAEFDAASQRITTDRGAHYAHPAINFRRIADLHRVINECPDPLVRHALQMIAVKISRLIETPNHLDSWIDIMGYARTGVMVTDK